MKDKHDFVTKFIYSDDVRINIEKLKPSRVFYPKFTHSTLNERLKTAKELIEILGTDKVNVTTIKECEKFIEEQINSFKLLQNGQHTEPKKSEHRVTQNDKTQSEKKIIQPKPPGGQLTSLLQTICSKRVFESIFEQVITDARVEYFEALFEKKFKLARWRKIQLYLVIIATGFSLVSASAVKKIITIYKAI